MSGQVQGLEAWSGGAVGKGGISYCLFSMDGCIAEDRMDEEEAKRSSQGEGVANLTNSAIWTWSFKVASTVSAPSPSLLLVNIHRQCLTNALIPSCKPATEV